jgi:hypothetical protein
MNDATADAILVSAVFFRRQAVMRTMTVKDKLNDFAKQSSPVLCRRRRKWEFCCGFLRRRLLASLMILSASLIWGDALTAAETTVDDILAGIEARRSMASSIGIKYRWTKKYTPFYFDHRQKMHSVQIRLGIIPKDTPLQKGPPAQVSETFAVAFQDNLIAYRKSEANTGALIEQAIYDGDVFRWFDPNRQQALVDRMASNAVINFPIIADAFAVTGEPLENLLEREKAHVQVVEERVDDNGDLLIELRLRTQPKVIIAGNEGGQAAEHEHHIVINASRDFWPQRLAGYLIPPKPLNGGKPTEPTLMYHLSIEGYFPPGEINYPKKIVIQKYDRLFDAERLGGPVTAGEPTVSQIETFDVEEVKINSIDVASEYAVTFTPETTVLDRVNGGQYLVGQDGALTDLAEALKHPILKPEDYTWEEAKEILIKYRRDEQSAELEQSVNWMVIVNVAVICFIIGTIAYRRYRRGSSTSR